MTLFSEIIFFSNETITSAKFETDNTSRESPLFEFDFFETLEENIRRFSQLGDILLCGDLNSRVGLRSDIVENINIHRFVNAPDDDDILARLPVRKSSDKTTNCYGNKLLSLCKLSSLYILNGRLEPGNFTCYNLSRKTAASSIVDYVICDKNLYDIVKTMCVHELSEYSDHILS